MSSLQSPSDTDSAEFPAGIAEVSDELLAMFGGSESALGRVAGPNADDAFNHLALKVHAAQRASSPVLRRYWDAVSHGQPAAWDEIPTVPVRAFRDVPIVSGTPEVVFRTSGTTGGGVRGGGSNARRGEHHVASLELYRAAARDNYRRHLFAGAPALSIISLVPNPADVPDSSLATMAGFIAREKEVAQTAWAFGPGSGVDIDTVRKAVAAAARVIDAARESGIPVIFTGDRYAAGGGDAGVRGEKFPSLAEYLRDGEPWVEIDPRVAPRPGEPIIWKKASSAFANTYLVPVLQHRGVDTLIFVGAATSGCVRASVTDAVSANFRVVVVEEAVCDKNVWAHKASLFDMWRYVASVAPMDDVLEWMRARVDTPGG